MGGQTVCVHIYPQDEEAHMVKLHAFLDMYLSGLPKDAADNIRRFWAMWNDRENIKTVSENRLNLGEIAPEWSQYATDWFKKLTVRTIWLAVCFDLSIALR